MRATILLVMAALAGTSAHALAQHLAAKDAAAKDGVMKELTAGEQSFKKCAACHALGPDAVNKVGPVLNGLDGRPAGTWPGYSYSEANKKSGIVWNEASFKAYIKHPADRIPGTKMPFAGIPRDKEIAALWVYVRQFDAKGQKIANVK